MVRSSRFQYSLLLCLACCTMPLAAIAQTGVSSATFITVENGLPTNTIRDLAQRKTGYIWIATDDGLSRYDGYIFKTYRNRPGDSLSLPGNSVFSVYEDIHGIVWAGTSAGFCRFDPTSQAFTTFTKNPKQKGSISNSYVYDMYEDYQGRFWLATVGGGLNLMDRQKGTFEAFYPDTLAQNYLQVSIIPAMCGSKRNRDVIWLLARTGPKMRITRFDIQNKTFTPISLPADYETMIGHTILEDRNGWLWIGTDNGVLRVDPATGTVISEAADPRMPRNRIFDLMETADGAICISALNEGVWLRYPNGNTERVVNGKETPSGEKAVNFPTKLLEDRSGVLWVGSEGNGLIRCRRDKKPFQTLHSDPASPRYSAAGFITALCEDREGRIWSGGNWKGVDCYHRKTGKFEPLAFPQGDIRKEAPWILSIAEAPDGQIWIGANARGVFRVDMAGRSYQRYLNLPLRPGEPGNTYVNSLYIEPNGMVWAGTYGGLYKIDPVLGQITTYRKEPGQANSICDDYIGHIQPGPDNTLWIATNAGISHFDPAKGAFRHFLYNPADSAKLGSGIVRTLCLDKAGNVWAGTPRGLYRLRFNGDYEKEPEITHYTETTGLASNNISGVLADGKGRIWISSKRGLSVFKNPLHPADELPEFQYYYQDDGLQSDGFSMGAYYKNGRGEMFFGGTNGYNVFHPDSIQDNPHRPVTVISSFRKYEVNHPEKGAIEVPGAGETGMVELSYTNNIVTISFAALDFRDPGKNRYAYQLEGFSDNWIQLGTQHEVTFTNLDPGTYTFRVKGTNDDGVWSEQPAELKIIVHPPWYNSWPARIFYLACFIGAVYALYRYQLRRRLELAETERLKTLDEFKTRFFTNITHEFRTPLTVILGMEDQLSGGLGKLGADQIKQSLRAIKKSGENLLRLVNQILDLASLENNSMKMNYIQGDMLAYLRYIAESMTSLANTQNLMLRVESPHARLFMDYDPERIIQIVHNLLSNAIKFTPSGGRITIKLDAENIPEAGSSYSSGSPSRAIIAVSDTGAGIPESELPFLFDRFFQVTQQHRPPGGGSGIGLSYTRELLRAMGGDIEVESKVGVGSTFRVYLPLRREAMLESVAPTVTLPAMGTTASIEPPLNTALPTLLLIEDNPDVVEYLSVCLKDTYQIEYAYNGRAGIEKAQELIPDLIISDLMMPEKDGYEVCDVLKNNTLTSHIPILLLTARVDLESRIAGLRKGADAYLAKPFHQEELLLTLRNMMALRQKLQGHISAVQENVEPSDTEGFEMEDAFVSRLREVVMAHLSEAGFNVEQLCREMAMSQPQLHRKLSALTGKNASQFIRSIRMETARKLLNDKNKTVSEVAFEVGFDDPKYFSRVFTETFGIPPSKL